MATTNWLNTAGGAFTDPANWDHGVPGTGDEAVIAAAGTYIVSLAAVPKTVAALEIDATTATLAIDAAASLHVTGMVSNAGILGVDSNLYASEGSSLTIDGALTNTGTVEVDTGYQGGNSTFTVAGRFTNQGTFALGQIANNAVSSTATFGSLDTSGTFNVGGGAQPGSPGPAVVNTITVMGVATASGGYMSVLSGGVFSAASFDIKSGGTVYVAGGTLSALTTVESGGLLDVLANESLATPVTINAGGKELVESGATTDAPTINGGTFEIADGGSVTSAPITFASLGGTLQIDSGTMMPTTEIDGFGGTSNSRIDLTSVMFDMASPQPTLLSDATHHNVLEVKEGTGTYDVQLDPNHDYTGTVFKAERDASGGGTLVVCYRAGTRIRTNRGGLNVDIAVETLTVGDLVVTASGAHRPIRWLGHRTIDCRSHPAPRKAWPVRITKDAFGHNKPERDLFVSPGHAICVDVAGEILISASALVNGATITQVAVDTVTYWHVELDSHDVLLADGLPAESYRDTGNRTFFAGGANNPDAEQKTHADFRHPFHYKGLVVDAVRAQLAVRATAQGWTPDRDADLHLVVDGTVVRPFGGGDTALFLFPAASREVRLTSNTFVPADCGGSDTRRLGVRLHGLSVSATEGPPRRMSLDEPALADQFHASERANARTWRWTQGELALAPTLWCGLSGDVVLRLSYVSATIRGYLPPTVAVKTDVIDDALGLYAVA